MILDINSISCHVKPQYYYQELYSYYHQRAILTSHSQKLNDCEEESHNYILFS